MSRNFDLLNKAEQEQAAATQVAGPQPATRPAERPAAAPLPSGTPEFQLEPQSHEQLNKLVQRLFLLPGSYRTVVFSSVERGSGCTRTAAHCAALLAAQVNGTVCLVDANLRDPAWHKFLHMENHSNGFSDALLGSAPLGNYLRQMSRRNLSVVTCGSASHNIEAMMASDALRSRLMQLRAEFDYVLIDAPPVNLHTDAITLGSAADGVLLILKANSSRHETAQKALLDFKMAKVRVLGAVLNQRTFPVPHSIYSKL